jgi:hypothetical protein
MAARGSCCPKGGPTSQSEPPILSFLFHSPRARWAISNSQQ